MNALESVATDHPVIFVISLTIAWFLLVMVLTGVASSALRRPYGDAATAALGRLAVTVCILLMVWRLGWLEPSGVARLGSWQVWLIALGGLIYFTSASLYSFYGKVAFDLTSAIRLPASRTTALTHLAAGLSEEILFRGVVLYGLARVWGNTRPGMIGSVVLTSVLFAILHITQVFTHGVSLSSALLLTLETWIVSIWWGALALLGGSIWPAVMLHFVVNAVVAVQGLAVPMVEPDILAYRRIFWFSIPLGVLGIGLLARAAPLAVFGAPATLDDCTRAVSTALEIQETPLRPRVRHAKDLDCAPKIGVAGGIVYAGTIGTSTHQSFCIVGPTYIEATRLGDIADPGQTLVAQAVYERTSDVIVYDKMPRKSQPAERGIGAEYYLALRRK